MSGVLATIDDFDENGKLKPGYRDKDGVWQRITDNPMNEGGNDAQ